MDLRQTPGASQSTPASRVNSSPSLWQPRYGGSFLSSPIQRRPPTMTDQPASKRRLDQAKPRFRIVFGEGERIGPGKIELLEAIERTGSISGAGRALGMSYRRAWLLVDAMNAMFDSPVTTAAAGGAQGGGAQITGFGRELVAAYRRIEARTAAVVREELAGLDEAMGEAKP